MAENTARKLEPVSSASEMQYLWFIARGSVLKGPYATNELEALIKRKEIRFEDFCWRHGFREWRPLACVTDFDRRGDVKRATYPTVEVPYGGAEIVPFPSKGSRLSSERRMRERRSDVRAQVLLTKTRRRTLTIYEWAGAVIAAVALSYMTSYVALHEVYDKLTARMEIMRLGTEHEVGEAVEGPAPTAWAPMFSAPGLKTFVDESRGTYAEAVTRYLMPVETTLALPSIASKTEIKFQDLQIKANAELPLWNPAKDSVDPVYVRPTTFHAYMSGSNADTLWVELRGEPYVPQGTIPSPYTQGRVTNGTP